MVIQVRIVNHIDGRFYERAVLEQKLLVLVDNTISTENDQKMFQEDFENEDVMFKMIGFDLENVEAVKKDFSSEI